MTKKNMSKQNRNNFSLARFQNVHQLANAKYQQKHKLDAVTSRSNATAQNVQIQPVQSRFKQSIARQRQQHVQKPSVDALITTKTNTDAVAYNHQHDLVQSSFNNSYNTNYSTVDLLREKNKKPFFNINKRQLTVPVQHLPRDQQVSIIGRKKSSSSYVDAGGFHKSLHYSVSSK